MPAGQARTADDIADTLRSLVDRVVDAKVTHEMTKRGQELAATLAEGANDAWRDSRPMRRDAAKRLSRAADDTAKWSDVTWRKSLRPLLRDAWKRRNVAVGAAAAAIPAGREIVDTAAVRLGIRQREERHWGAFFLGLVIGAVAGAIVAMLTTPKRGSEMRQDLGSRADEIATRARDEWVPMFQRDAAPDNGHGVETLPGESLSGPMVETPMTDAGVIEGAASGETADAAASEAAEAINDAYDGVDSESPA